MCTRQKKQTRHGKAFLWRVCFCNIGYNFGEWSLFLDRFHNRFPTNLVALVLIDRTKSKGIVEREGGDAIVVGGENGGFVASIAKRMKCRKTNKPSNPQSACITMRTDHTEPPLSRVFWIFNGRCKWLYVVCKFRGFYGCLQYLQRNRFRY